jgi:hypothetical protein
VETLLLTSMLEAQHLPGLEPPYFSRLRDTVCLLLQGLPAVSVVLLVGESLPDLQTAPVSAQLDLVLAEQPGALLLFPDLGSPVQASHDLPLQTALDLAFSRWEASLVGLQRILREHFQVALIDAPQPSAPAIAAWYLHPRWRSQPVAAPRQALETYYARLLEDAVSRIHDLDAAVLVWEGAFSALLAHGWHSPSALAARSLLEQRTPTPLALLEARCAPLPPTRRAELSREAALFSHFPRAFELPDHLR